MDAIKYYTITTKKEDCINKIVLLAPCDIPSEGKKVFK